MDGGLTLAGAGEEVGHLAELGVERTRLGDLGDQSLDGDTLVRGEGAVERPLDQVDVVGLKHAHPLGSRSASRSRSRAVKRRDFTVLTGTSSTSAISS